MSDNDDALKELAAAVTAEVKSDGPETPDDEEPEPPPHIHRCKYGHRQVGEGRTVYYGSDGAKYADSGPSCIKCQVEWIGKKFPTWDTGVNAVEMPKAD